jgi:ketosteroid isomerase-like protein
MSQENVELWQASIEAVRSRLGDSDAEGALAEMAKLWDPQIEWDSSAAAELPDIDMVYRGREAVRRFWRQWLAAWELVEFEYELVDAGDSVVCLLDQRMRGRSTGIELPMGKYAQVATFRDGLMVHWKVYASQSDALKAVGLAE